MTTRTRSIRSTQRNLLLIWAIAFAADLYAVIHLYAVDWIELEYFQAGIQRVSAIYAPYLGIVIAAYWGGGSLTSGSADRSTRNVAGVLAVCFSLLFNALLAFLLLRLLFGAGAIEDALETAERLAAALGWLVAPALGYYFANSLTISPK